MRGGRRIGSGVGGSEAGNASHPAARGWKPVEIYFCWAVPSLYARALGAHFSSAFESQLAAPNKESASGSLATP